MSPSPPATVPLSCARPPLIHWHAVSVAASVGIFLIAGAFAWIATHPAHKDRGLPVVLASAAPVEALPVALPTPTAQPVLQVVTRSEPVEPAEPPAPHPAPAPAAPAPEPPRPEPAAPVLRHPTETYGTQVNFLGLPQEAAEQARREQKLLFFLHVSGNFEESCFT